MMVEISKRSQLSRTYTNHCIRATTISALSHTGVEARHIMTVSGHRNETSVKSYVRDTTSEQKRQMSSSTDPGSFKLTDISYRFRFSFVSFACTVRSFFAFRSLAFRAIHETNTRYDFQFKIITTISILLLLKEIN